jgi:hypothetical protein
MNGVDDMTFVKCVLAAANNDLVDQATGVLLVDPPYDISILYLGLIWQRVSPRNFLAGCVSCQQMQPFFSHPSSPAPPSHHARS